MQIPKSQVYVMNILIFAASWRLISLLSVLCWWQPASAGLLAGALRRRS